MEQLDIVKLIEENPITNLSNENFPLFIFDEKGCHK